MAKRRRRRNFKDLSYFPDLLAVILNGLDRLLFRRKEKK